MNKSPPSTTNGLRVSRETEERLRAFEALHRKWSKAINLVAPSTLPDLWQRHILDSSQIYRLAPGPRQWIDLGSGGGFPGIVTGIMLAESGDGWVHLVESNNKKAAFLRAAIAETGARASVHPIRIEDAQKAIPECDSISARALAELQMLLEFVSPWMLDRPSTRAFFHKGRDYQSEIDKAVGCWRFDLLKHPSVVEPDSLVLEISNLSRNTL
ncbi:16S rRNA (guanine(527)-N(7))-methyltransferase RsmG [Sinorhizobium sp. BG8]|uniref:16S rRNA (guanine(527)-N(7))-methyltransferase RsmG n=1 Tax=Sinorhizobium sp. BG8 TaxID=2613773 RepID=UPI00193D8965|nr:16S rRNA (guanine(527)-N(7))-methyltransferase RsmG [Sinorhizobium sp. BG8]QRM53632.1 16S rRNA (guanine(527)-N(7))-methyltransferase RsmG [Sinorhizobium sp. BG8]